MSRRDSRASLNARQNDALFEFENFKKKFLLANKHITKLNSTLSVRIEELNAQISTLYVENLRLRASEIALAAQLKREREKSRKVMADAEAATQNLTKHLSYLRHSYNISETSPRASTPPSPRATSRRSPPDPNNTNSPATPLGNRISRPPNVPGIYEDEEPLPSSSEQDQEKAASPPRRKTKTKPRLSASKLPLPSRVVSPPPIPASVSVPAPAHVDLAAVSVVAAAKRKAARRQSGLLTVNTDALSVPRAASPAFGSPIRLQAGLEEEEEEMAALNGDRNVDYEMVDPEEVPPPTITITKKEKRKSKPKERESESEKDSVGVGSTDSSSKSRDKKRQRDEDDGTDAPKFKLKDVTNSRTALQPIDNTVHEQIEPTILQSKAPLLAARAFLSSLPEATSRSNSRGPSSPAPSATSATSDADGLLAAGRERRARKSVNYAEPKLNTKMRKPDPISGDEPTRFSATGKKRSSDVTASSSYRPPMDGNDADADTEARSSLEMPPPILKSTLLRGVNGNYIDPEAFPLPPSRPTSTMGVYSPGPPPKSPKSSSSSSGSSSSRNQEARRKKSRSQMLLDEGDEDDESDGAQADGEYVPPGMAKRGSTGEWGNVETRRKAARRSTQTSGDSGLSELDGRRHSMAV